MPDAPARQSAARYERLWIDESVELDATPAEIHAVLSAIDSWASWVPGLVAVRHSGSGPLRVGSRFGMHIAMPPLPAFWVPCKLFASRPDYIEWGGGGPGARIRHRFEITPLPSGRTRVRHVEYATNWLAAILIPFEGVFHRHDARWNAAIAARFPAAAEAAPEGAAA